MAMTRIFLGFYKNWFLIDPLHYLSSRFDFGFEFAEIFVIKKRLPDSPRRRVGFWMFKRKLAKSGSWWLPDSPSQGVAMVSRGIAMVSRGVAIQIFFKFFITLNSYTSPLKGQCHEIFDFWFFSWISFPQVPEYTIRVVSNFFENSRRYSQLKVCHRCQGHRWQMQKIFNHKSFNYLVWTPLGSIVNL